MYLYICGKVTKNIATHRRIAVIISPRATGARCVHSRMRQRISKPSPCASRFFSMRFPFFLLALPVFSSCASRFSALRQPHIGVHRPPIFHFGINARRNAQRTFRLYFVSSSNPSRPPPNERQRGRRWFRASLPPRPTQPKPSRWPNEKCRCGTNALRSIPCPRVPSRWCSSPKHLQGY